MHAYELLPRLTHLTLAGQDDEGRLEFIGSDRAWRLTDEMQDELLNNEDMSGFEGTLVALNGLRI